VVIKQFQLTNREYKGKQYVAAYGLGDDGNLYEWNKFSGSWNLDLIKKKEHRESDPEYTSY
jgi:hypothetical protein